MCGYALFAIAGCVALGLAAISGKPIVPIAISLVGFLTLYTLHTCYAGPNAVVDKSMQFHERGGETSIQITDTALLVKNGRSETTFDWDEFTRFRELSTAFVLFFRVNTTYLIIPKRFFEPDPDLAECREFLGGKLGQ